MYRILTLLLFQLIGFIPTWALAGVNLSELQSKIESCKERESKIVIIVPNKYELGEQAVADEIVASAYQQLREKCPPSPRTQGAIALLYQKRISPWSEVYCTFTGLNPPACQSDAANRLASTRQQQEQQKRHAEEKSRQEAAAKREKESADRKVQVLADKFNANWIPWNSVKANPFAFEGQSFLANTQFSRMLSADTALFTGGLVVVGVPRTAFVEPKEVVLVGRVIDSDPAKNPPGIQGNSVRMKYLGHEFCSKANCRDFGTITK